MSEPRYTVRRIPEAKDDWWDVLDGDEPIALCGPEGARLIAAALNAHSLDLDSPETVERLVNAVHTARIGEPSHGHPDGLHVSCNDLVAAILAALREQDTPPAAIAPRIRDIDLVEHGATSPGYEFTPSAAPLCEGCEVCVGEIDDCGCVIGHVHVCEAQP